MYQWPGTYPQAVTGIQSPVTRSIGLTTDPPVSLALLGPPLFAKYAREMVEAVLLNFAPLSVPPSPV